MNPVVFPTIALTWNDRGSASKTPRNRSETRFLLFVTNPPQKRWYLIKLIMSGQVSVFLRRHGLINLRTAARRLYFSRQTWYSISMKLSGVAEQGSAGNHSSRDLKA